MKTMNRYISSLTLLFLLTVATPLLLSAQHTQISVSGTGEVEVEADILLFNVTITHVHGSPKTAFDRHKEQEAFLTRLLISENIAEENIYANPVNISPIRRQQEGSGYETRQNVTIRINDVAQFEAMQITLIENGFVNFSGNFASSMQKESADKALAQAVEDAKMKAEILARASGKELIDIITIEYGTRGEVSPRSSPVMYAMEAGDSSLLQFRQTITVRERVHVVFTAE
jgi:uncharacterized protein